MKLLDVTAEFAEDALLRLGRHVDRGAEIGRVRIVRADDGDGVGVLTDTALWSVRADGADRVLPLRDGRVEVTSFVSGVEVSRRLVGR